MLGLPVCLQAQSSSATSAAGIRSDAKTKVIIILLQYAVDRHKYLVYVGYEELTADHAKPLDFTKLQNTLNKTKVNL